MYVCTNKYVYNYQEVYIYPPETNASCKHIGSKTSSKTTSKASRINI